MASSLETTLSICLPASHVVVVKVRNTEKALNSNLLAPIDTQAKQQMKQL